VHDTAGARFCNHFSPSAPSYAYSPREPKRVSAPRRSPARSGKSIAISTSERLAPSAPADVPQAQQIELPEYTDEIWHAFDPAFTWAHDRRLITWARNPRVWGFIRLCEISRNLLTVENVGLEHSNGARDQQYDDTQRNENLHHSE
jgi:hypothetical protein